jgi:hypothetical protein
MIIKKVSLERTFYLVKYEPIKVGFEAELEQGESTQNALKKLMDEIYNYQDSLEA